MTIWRGGVVVASVDPFRHGEPAGVAIRAGGSNQVEPLVVGSELSTPTLPLGPDAVVPVRLEVTYQEAWRRFPAVLKGLLKGSAIGDAQPPST